MLAQDPGGRVQRGIRLEQAGQGGARHLVERRLEHLECLLRRKAAYGLYAERHLDEELRHVSIVLRGERRERKERRDEPAEGRHMGEALGLHSRDENRNHLVAVRALASVQLSHQLRDQPRQARAADHPRDQAESALTNRRLVVEAFEDRVAARLDQRLVRPLKLREREQPEGLQVRVARLDEALKVRRSQLRELRARVGHRRGDRVQAFKLERFGGSRLNQMGEGLDELLGEPRLMGHELPKELDHLNERPVGGRGGEHLWGDARAP